MVYRSSNPVMEAAGADFCEELTVVTAFHGTSRDSAKEIINSNFCIGSRPSYYLGDGVYFYEGDLESARTWISGKSKDLPWAVIRARLKLGKCLDLSIWEHKMAVQSFAAKLRAYSKTKLTDAEVINGLAKKLNCDSVRYIKITHKTTQPLFMGSSLDASITRIIICMRKLENIFNRTIVLEG